MALLAITLYETYVNKVWKYTRFQGKSAGPLKKIAIWRAACISVLQQLCKHRSKILHLIICDTRLTIARALVTRLEVSPPVNCVCRVNKRDRPANGLLSRSRVINYVTQNTRSARFDPAGGETEKRDREREVIIMNYRYC